MPDPEEFAFDRATAVVREAPGRYLARIDPEWSINGYTNGGYLLAVAVRAALAEAAPEHPDPLAVTGAFLAPAPAGPAELDVELLRLGRSTSVVRSRLTAGGAGCLETLVTAGRLTGELLHPGPALPPMPPQSTLTRAPDAIGPMRIPLLRHLAQWYDPVTAGFAVGRPAGAGELRAWVRFADDRPADPLSLMLFGDCLAPPSFDLPQVQLGWVPTLQLSIFVRAAPQPGPLVVRSVARSVGSGAMDETCDVWDSSGRQVAVAHQLAAIRPA